MARQLLPSLIMTAISDWPAEERPRERLRALGAAALSDGELLALLLGTGTGRENAVELARRIIAGAGGLDAVAGQGFAALARIKGVGEAKASRVVAALEFGVRVLGGTAPHGARRPIVCSADIFKAYQPRFALLRHEVFVALALNAKNAPIREIIVTQGSVNECRVEPKDVFRPMVAEAAARTVFVHNHPSGDPTPSPHDVALTKRLVEAGALIGIPVLDHVIVGRGAYASLRDLGLLDAGGH